MSEGSTQHQSSFDNQASVDYQKPEEQISTEEKQPVENREAEAVEEQAADVSNTEDSRHDKGLVTVKNYTLTSLTAAAIPLPLVDLGILTGVQVKMLYDLSRIYDVEFSSKIANAAIAPLVASTLPIVTTPLLASTIKFVPGVGQAAGVASMLVLGGAATHALGMVFIRHLEQGGNFADFDIKTVKEYFAEEFENGKKIATELKQKSQDKISELKTELS